MNDLLKRALHTFWQAFVITFLASASDMFNAFQHDMSAWKSLALALAMSSVAAGLSAVKTFVNNTK